MLVWFDADAMEKVLANLLSNAFKFTPASGRIALHIETRETTVLLRVTDTGPGIAPEYLPHVFERFYQVDESITRAQPGTGIGLALVRRAVLRPFGVCICRCGTPAGGPPSAAPR